ncbi:DUF1848 domain-containing protein [Clostridiales bacterium]|nr:DUF1848 domain-containing protein [Clostridiales bacterium]
MIINTGQRTDIPAFYSEWFANRLKAGFVLVRNPYNPISVTRYRLSPDVVDLIGFCTKNPAPMLPKMDLLRDYGQYWYVTITPYGKEIEPRVPDKREVLESFRQLSEIVGPERIGWRYDPVFISDAYPAERHIRAFEYMAKALEGYTHTAVISFVDLYEKTKRNFPEVRPVDPEQRLLLGKAFTETGRQYGMTIRPCGEGDELAQFGADCGGCMTVAMYEQALGRRLKVPKFVPARKECACYLGGDIGAYNTCGHLCRYCYANYDAETVRRNMAAHDPQSPMLTGHLMPGDQVHEARQESWIDPQISMDDMPGL